MGWKSFGFGVVVWGGFAAGLGIGPSWRACAQTGAVAPQTTLTGELQSLASRAATVFAGQVVSVERKGGVVETTFRVDQAVLGQPGARYTLREWAGLWPQGQLRYTAGERALIFLRGSSAAGLGSPVDGAEGVVPIVVQGADAPALLDVRRISSAVQRSIGTPLASEADGAIQLTDAVALISASRAGGAPRLAAPVRLRLPLRGGFPRIGLPIPEPLVEGTSMSPGAAPVRLSNAAAVGIE